MPAPRESKSHSVSAPFTFTAVFLTLALPTLASYKTNSVADSSYSARIRPAFSRLHVLRTASALATEAAPAVVTVNAYKEAPAHTLHYAIVNGQIVLMNPQADGRSQKVSSGSGFFITEDGYILTNRHVVADNGALYKIDYGGENEAVATVVYRDPNADLAILKIDGTSYPALPLGDSSRVYLGERVVALGDAHGRSADFATEGTIIALNQTVTTDDLVAPETLVGVMESSVELYPGDSGGPMLDQNGSVIGVNTATVVSGQSVVAGYSIPINVAKSTLREAGITA